MENNLNLNCDYFHFTIINLISMNPAQYLHCHNRSLQYNLDSDSACKCWWHCWRYQRHMDTGDWMSCSQGSSTLVDSQMAPLYHELIHYRVQQPQLGHNIWNNENIISLSSGEKEISQITTNCKSTKYYLAASNCMKMFDMIFLVYGSGDSHKSYLVICMCNT